MQCVCMVNPFAGKRKAVSLSHSLAERLVSRGHEVRLLETTPYPDEFRARCRTIRKQERVICVGGDGTLRNFIDYSSEFHSLAFYGTGTTNVNTIEYGIPRDLDNFIDMLEEGHHIHICPGQTQEGTKFFMMFSFGIDGFILSRVSHRQKMCMGKAAFLLPVIKALFHYSYPLCQVELDGGRCMKGSVVIVSRIKYYGGSFIVAPEANSQSNSFQVVILKNAGILKTFKFYWQMARGRLTSSKEVAIETAEKVKITHNCQPVYCQLDGNFWPEMIEELSISSMNIPFIIPKRYALP